MFNFENFDLLTDLPWLLGGICLLGVFVVAAWGTIVLLMSRGYEAKADEARNILMGALTGFFIVLLVMAVFFIISYFMRSGEVLKPKPVSADFPEYLAFATPPAPPFIKIGPNYFSGPFALSKNNILKAPAVYAILCKNGQTYDTIYVEGGERRSQLLGQPQYRCWLENCQNNAKNLYVAFFWNTVDQSGASIQGRIKAGVLGGITAPCSNPQPE